LDWNPTWYNLWATRDVTTSFPNSCSCPVKLWELSGPLFHWVETFEGSDVHGIDCGFAVDPKIADHFVDM
jgi:hypothetical protein